MPDIEERGDSAGAVVGVTIELDLKGADVVARSSDGGDGSVIVLDDEDELVPL